MSAFDDEFGLFSEGADETERRSTLGARKISARGENGPRVAAEKPAPRSGPSGRSERPRPMRSGGDPYAGQRRASSVLEFLTKRLVSLPDAVQVELFADEHGEPVIEIIVDPEDIGKVIGRSGRVAGALRTLARASAQDRVSVDILDSEEAAEETDGEADENAD
ncbi:MAG: KH domain-containing protein [Vulcanimicrobiaceae bacterium]